VIHYDRTKFAVLVWCDCGWRELMITRDGARQSAADHERNVHPELSRARENFYHYRARDRDGDEGEVEP
jgi:hypothetical protein